MQLSDPGANLVSNGKLRLHAKPPPLPSPPTRRWQRRNRRDAAEGLTRNFGITYVCGEQHGIVSWWRLMEKRYEVAASYRPPTGSHCLESIAHPHTESRKPSDCLPGTRMPT